MKIDFLGLKKSKKIFSKASYKYGLHTAYGGTLYIRPKPHTTVDYALCIIVHCAELKSKTSTTGQVAR